MWSSWEYVIKPTISQTKISPKGIQNYKNVKSRRRLRNSNAFVCLIVQNRRLRPQTQIRHLDKVRGPSSTVLWVRAGVWPPSDNPAWRSRRLFQPLPELAALPWAQCSPMAGLPYLGCWWFFLTLNNISRMCELKWGCDSRKVFCKFHRRSGRR